MFTKGEDGGLYYLGGGRGSNIFYAGHTFEIDKESEDEIGFKATAYYTNSNEAYKGDYFYTTPDNPEDYTTRNFCLYSGRKMQAGDLIPSICSSDFDIAPL